MKQSKLRRRRVIRFAILYFVLLVLFLALIVGPSVAKKQIPDSLYTSINDIMPSFNLVQPNGQDNDNTNGTSETGTGMDGYTGAGLKTSSGAAKATGNSKIKLF